MTKSSEKYYKIVCPSNKQEGGNGWGNNLLMQREGTLIKIFPCGSTNKLRGFGASKLGCSRSWLGGMPSSVLFSHQ